MISRVEQTFIEINVGKPTCSADHACITQITLTDLRMSASKPTVRCRCLISGRGWSPSKTRDWFEGSHTTLSSAQSAELCSGPWLAETIRRLVIEGFRFGLFTNCVDPIFFVLGSIFADAGRF